jgi:hypothetical protein
VGSQRILQSLISPDSLLVSNEVIRGRVPVLTDNIIKWGSSNVIVTNADPAWFRKLEGFFDVLVVDAPCSGSGLFRRDESAMEEWSLNNVQLCSQRQQRILADVLPCLKTGGLLVYSTCSYSREEDEAIAEWLLNEQNMSPEKLRLDPAWNIVKTETQGGAEGYRFYPDKVKGEGFFMSCFRKTEEQKSVKARTSKPEKATAKEQSVVLPFLQPGSFVLLKEKEQLIALPEHLVDDFMLLKAMLPVYYRGTGIGQVMKEKLVPDHSLALSNILNESVPKQPLDQETAIRYLQRQDLSRLKPR